MEPSSPTLQVDSLPAEPQGKPQNTGVDSLSLLHEIFPSRGIELGSPALQACFVPTELSGKPIKSKAKAKISDYCAFWHPNAYLTLFSTGVGFSHGNVQKVLGWICLLLPLDHHHQDMRLKPLTLVIQNPTPGQSLPNAKNQHKTRSHGFQRLVLFLNLELADLTKIS